jgi:hypothetical protein
MMWFFCELGSLIWGIGAFNLLRRMNSKKRPETPLNPSFHTFDLLAFED